MIVSVLNRKGGVGKTTVTVNLAAALADHGVRILMVDIDPQASASLSLGIARADLPPSIADVLYRRLLLPEALRKTEIPGLDMLTGSADLASAQQDLARCYRTPERALATVLQPIADLYDLILVDCPAGLPLLAHCALIASDGLLVPTTPTFLACEGVENTLAACQRVVQRHAAKSRLLGIVINQSRSSTEVCRAKAEALRDRYGESVLQTEVPHSVRLIEAPEAGVPISRFAPESRAAQAFHTLAAEVLERARPGTSGVPVNLRTTANLEDTTGIRWQASRLLRN